MKKVVVSQRVDLIRDRDERRDALDQRLIAWLVAAGYLPVPMPNTLDHSNMLQRWLDVIAPDAVVLSGGNDVGGCPERDASERDLIRWAALRGIPLLGICRGMQMMGVVAGVELVRVSGHAGSRHDVRGNIERREVGSYHDYALATCPVEFDVMARSSDEVIEAMRHRTLPWEGWMWHPEREAVPQADDVKRIRALFGQ